MIWFWIEDEHGNYESYNDLYLKDRLSGMQVRLIDAWEETLAEAIEGWLNDQSYWRYTRKDEDIPEASFGAS